MYSADSSPPRLAVEDLSIDQASLGFLRHEHRRERHSIDRVAGPFQGLHHPVIACTENPPRKSPTALVYSTEGTTTLQREQEGRRTMQQDPLFQREMVREVHPLGALEAEYVTDPRKFLASFGLIFGFFALFWVASMVFGIFRQSAVNVITLFIFSFLFFFFILVVGGFFLVYYLAYRHLHVYVYTNGLFYSNEATRLVYWPQVAKASLNRGNMYLKVKNQAGISIPINYLSNSGELRDRIEQKIATSRTLR